MKKPKHSKQFLEELRKVPIVQVACEKTGISRNTLYRWKRTDPEFTIAFDEALAEGEALVNDMSESQLLTLIKEKNFSALSFWLRHRNPRFKDKVEVTTKIGITEDILTPEQEAIVAKALSLATYKHDNPINHV
jgi:predicted DNA binding protein